MLDITVVLIIFGVWLLLVTSVAIYFYFRLLPLIKQLRKVRGGDITVTKIMFPPKFYR